ncbi:MAG: nucleotidyltransferase domain-containing protein [Euryarchaeota archaeon]|jgi:predicted nucleotidyltransferase|nr:nucleotidyltransferase domain-containing protein [Euryarchaeota archaeon]
MSVRETLKRERAFEEFARIVMDALDEEINEIILYGSTARKAAVERSDVDVMVVLDGKATSEQRDTIIAAAFDVCLEYEVDIIPNIQSKDRLDARRDHPFIRTVLAEGRVYG